MEYTSPSQRKKALGKCPLSRLKFFDCELFEPLPIPETGDWLKSVRKEKGQILMSLKNMQKTETSFFYNFYSADRIYRTFYAEFLA